MTELEILALMMLGAFFGLLMIGIPVGLTLAATGFLFGYLGFGATLFNLLPARIFGVVTNYTLLAIPLFVFMGVMLEKSRLAEDLMDALALATGRLRGGMGLAIILVGVLMGASTGIVGATVVTLGLLTLPTLIRRGYSKSLASGTICASGTLGQIIPPSLVLILLADITAQSVGTLFAAALLPGLMLAGIYCAYMVGIGVLRPEIAPAASKDELASFTRGQLWLRILKVVVPPLALVVAVLGSIIGGVAAPTEAASMGALGSMLMAAAAGRLDMRVLSETLQLTTRITATVLFILICAQVFALAFRGLRGEQLVHDLFAFLPGGIAADIWFMMLLIFVLGFFIEWIEISYIAVPLFMPVFDAAGVDKVWLCTMICLNLQTSFLTPPFGWALFFLKGVAPPEVRTVDIYLGIIPFVAMQAAALLILFLQPQIATWLPTAIGW
ncbi:MAG TPA: TRAP transporter large permease subunit [Geminicoccaceae bacterium]